LCVRDAAAGQDGSLLLADLRHRPLAGLSGTHPHKVAKGDLDLLCQNPGLPAVYSSYSTRKGYAQQAQLDDWPVEDIQEGLRHIELDTTLSHYLAHHGAKQAATKLMRKSG
jgi:hypothetical protein